MYTHVWSRLVERDVEMGRQEERPLRMAEVFAQARTVVLSDRGLMVVGHIVCEERGITLVVLDDGRCAATQGDGEWYLTNPALTGVEPDNVLAEIERLEGERR